MNKTNTLILKHCVEKLLKANKADVGFGYLTNKTEVAPTSEVVCTTEIVLPSTAESIFDSVRKFVIQSECLEDELFVSGINIALQLPLLANKKIDNVRYIPIKDNKKLYAIVILINVFAKPKESKPLVDVQGFITAAVALLQHNMKPVTQSLNNVDDIDQKLVDKLLNNTFHPVLLFNDDLKVIKFNSSAQRAFSSNTQKGWLSIDKIVEKYFPENALQLFSTINKYTFLGHLDNTQWENIKFCQSEYQYTSVDIHLFDYKQDNKQFFGLMINEKLHEHGEHIEQYHDATQRFKALTNVIPTGIIQVDSKWKCSYVNETWTRYTGLDLARSTDLQWQQCLSEHDIKNLLPKILKATLTNTHLKQEVQLHVRPDKAIWVEIHSAGLFSSRYELTGMILTIQDITKTKTHAEELTKLANYDHLTGLANRAFFTDRLEVALSRVKRHGLMAVMFIDLDKFKNINDTLGHPVGDKVIQEVGRRLKAAVREEDSIARLGGDEFAIILTDVMDAKFLYPIAEKIIESLHPNYVLNDKRIPLSCSVGIATSDDDVSSAADILQKADLALYKAKDSGRNQYCFYAKHLEKSTLILSHLNQSINNNDNSEFSVLFQPQISPFDKSIVGFEALARWSPSQFERIGPSVFIPLIESNGLIEKFSTWLLHEVIEITSYWHKRELLTEEQKMSVNLSAGQLHLEDLADNIIHTINKFSAKPSWFTIEVTETAFIKNPVVAGTNLQKLREEGLTIALDDFGTGYSSLSLLRQIPINFIKIDCNFVKDILVDDDNASIVRAIINLADMLKMGVIAEGVEDKSTANWLLDNQCSIHQGYFYYQPLTKSQVVTLLSEQTGTISLKQAIATKN